VLTTVHSSSCIEALQRIVGAFPAEIQSSIAAQLADCLVGVVAQRLEFRAELKIRVPECEILIPNHPAKAHIRNREFFKISSVLETGADAGMWTWQRYRTWMKRRNQWHVPGTGIEMPDSEPGDESGVVVALGESTNAIGVAETGDSSKWSGRVQPESGRRIEIEPVEGGLDSLLKRLQ
jgi:twitching motility protein PilT